MATLPTKYAWLNNIQDMPNELKIALTRYGTLEDKGPGDNPSIMRWAVKVGVAGWYPHDSVAWCGLFKGINAMDAGWLPKPKYDLLSALSWLAWGVEIKKDQAMLGDTLIFSRPGGGHVGYYIGEDATHFCVYGGNQSDAVTFTWIEKSRLMGVRRAKWRQSQPTGVKKYFLSREGEVISCNEA